MSLNRAAHAIFEYIENHAEERQFWQGKVRDLMGASQDDFGSATVLADELRRYAAERVRVGALPAQVIGREELGGMIFRSLAEHLMRIWGPVRPVRPTRPSGGDEISL